MKVRNVEELLQVAEEIVETTKDSKELLDALDEVDRQDALSPIVLCKSAQLLYRFAIYTHMPDFFVRAHEKLQLVENRHAAFLDEHCLWRHLWGNILLQLGKYSDEKDFFELALDQYKKSDTNQAPPELYWDWGEAWLFLGRLSMELSDLHQGITKLHIAEQRGISSPFFLMDFGCGYMQIAMLSGNPDLLEKAISYFQKIVEEAEGDDESDSIIYKTALAKLAASYTLRFHLTHAKEDFEKAEAFVQETILAIPQNSTLWLDWAELFLDMGWLRRDQELIETAIEKLTSLKTKECEPTRLALLLGRSLLLLGLFLENHKLLKEGAEQIESAADASTIDGLMALGFKELTFAIYFSEEEGFEKTAALFGQCVEKDNYAISAQHLLYQTYQMWALHAGKKNYLYKALKLISRISELRPYSSLYKNEWGVALLNMAKATSHKEKAQGLIEKSIEKFEESLGLGGNEWTIYNMGCAYDFLGDLTLNENEFEKAIDLLSRASKIRPSDFQIRYHLAQALLHLGELVASREYLSQAINIFKLLAEMDDEDEQVLNALGFALLNSSQLAFDADQETEGLNARTESEKALLQAARLGSAEACYYLACLYSLAGLAELSLHYLSKAEEGGYVFSREDLEHDEWLDEIRNTDGFQEFLLRQE